MADFSTSVPVPGLGTTYTSVLSIINDKFTDLARGLDTTPATNPATATNVPINGIMWTGSLNKWRKWDGTTWQDLSSLYAISISGNAGTATAAAGIVVTNDVTSNITAYPTWVTGTSSAGAIKISSTKISMNPSTGDLTVAGTIASPGFLITGVSAGGGLFNGTGDNSSSTVANVQIKSWYGIGFAPSITGQTVPQNENAVWINIRTGDVTARGNITAYSSDERLKTNWLSLPENFVTNLALLKSGTYTRLDSNERQAGSSAQDWQKLLPEVVTSSERGILSLAYGNAALVSAIELAKEVVSLRDKLAHLEALVQKILESK